MLEAEVVLEEILGRVFGVGIGNFLWKRAGAVWDLCDGEWRLSGVGDGDEWIAGGFAE
jgi:hypothetical protein